MPEVTRPDPNAAATGSDLAGRVALVTGGSGGMGRAIALALAEHGARVAVHYASSPERAQAVVDDVAARGGRAWAVQADLGSATAPDELVTAVEQELGPVDVLVANHGIGPVRTSLDEIDAAEWDRIMAVNTRSPFLLARRVVPGMRERRFGRVLFTSSVAGFIGGVIGPDYAASKAALHGLTHYLASRLAGDGITVNAIAPALIRDTAILPGDPDELAGRLPVGRLGYPDEVADLALTVLRTGYLTNQVIAIDGGMYPH